MKKYIKILKHTPPFSDIEEEDILSILKYLSAIVKNYETAATVFAEGDKIELAGIVLSGGVQVVRYDFYGNKSIVATIGEGQLFAEAFVFSNRKILPINIIASADSDILFINFKKFITTSSSSHAFHNKLIFNMLKVIADQTVAITEKIEILSKRTTREKIITYLNNQAKKTRSNVLSIAFNRQELADFLFVERSALSSELSKLRNEGVIEFSKNNFKILNKTTDI